MNWIDFVFDNVLGFNRVTRGLAIVLVFIALVSVTFILAR